MQAQQQQDKNAHSSFSPKFRTLNTDDIRALQEIDLDEVIDDEELRRLKGLKSRIGTDYVTFAQLALACHDHLAVNLFKFKSAKLQIFLDQYSLEALRSDVIGYGRGGNTGDYFRLGRIQSAVTEHRAALQSLIQLFFTLFSDES